jgi:DNA-directed RNA polymerase alpha subunit
VDDYDKLAQELATDMKARAVDRLKSAEELAKEEHERLVAAEKAVSSCMRETEREKARDRERKDGGSCVCVCVCVCVGVGRTGGRAT